MLCEIEPVGSRDLPPIFDARGILFDAFPPPRGGDEEEEEDTAAADASFLLGVAKEGFRRTLLRAPDTEPPPPLLDRTGPLLPTDAVGTTLWREVDNEDAPGVGGAAAVAVALKCCLREGMNE